jgi:hypothetical protein
LPFNKIFLGRLHDVTEELSETRVFVVVDSPLVDAEMYNRWKAVAGAALRAKILAVADESVMAERRMFDDNAEAIVSG